VGYGKQGKKLKDLFENTGFGGNFTVTAVDFRSTNYQQSNLIAECKNFDAFVITVPNKSLTDELLFFCQFEKPILIEKPLGNSKSDLEKLSVISNNCKAKILVNYPFPHSKLAIQIKGLFDSKVLGEILRIEVTHGHGHAWTSEYKDSWRSKLDLGVISMSTVHHLNYWLTIFGIPADVVIELRNHAKSGDAPDTGYVYASFPSGVDLSIFSSYAIPSIFSLRIIGTEGIFHYDGKLAKLFAPREVLSISGRHISPVGAILDEFDFEQNWLVGQKKVIEIFCKGIQNNSCDFSNFENAISTFALLIPK
jgi:predicted dehydrogenase